MLDPVTQAVMVDPTLASDGKLYDRLTLQGSHFLDHATGHIDPLQIIGPDVAVRSWIHGTLPISARQYAARREICPERKASCGSAELAPPAVGGALQTPPPVAGASGPATGEASLEDEFRKQQILTLVYVGMATFTRFVGRIQQDPLLLREDIFQRLGILSERQSKGLVARLQKAGVLTHSRFGNRKVADLARLDHALGHDAWFTKALSTDQVDRCKQVVRWHAAFIEEHSATIASIAMVSDEMAALEVHQLSQPTNFSGVPCWYETRRETLRAERGQMIQALCTHRAPAEAPDVQATKPWRPSITRSQSFCLGDTGHHAAAAEDDALWTCPISYLPFCEPVLANDGYTYERTHAEQLRGKPSPMTRAPLEILARHPTKLMWAMQAERVPTAEYFRDTRPGAARDFKMEVIMLQRALAQLNKKPPEALQPQIFYHLRIVANPEQSAALFKHLQQRHVLNPLPAYANQVVDPCPQSALGAARIADKPLSEAHKDRIEKVLSLVAQEATRSKKLRAYITLLKADVALLENFPKQRAHAAARLRAAEAELSAII